MTLDTRTSRLLHQTNKPYSIDHIPLHTSQPARLAPTKAGGGLKISSRSCNQMSHAWSSSSSSSTNKTTRKKKILYSRQPTPTPQFRHDMNWTTCMSLHKNPNPQNCHCKTPGPISQPISHIPNRRLHTGPAHSSNKSKSTHMMIPSVTTTHPKEFTTNKHPLLVKHAWGNLEIHDPNFKSTQNMNTK
jgi:hypothetical protein